VGGAARRVAVVAGGGRVLAAGGGLAVNAPLVDLDGMLEADFQPLDEDLVLVARPAGRRQIGRMHPGVWIADRLDLVVTVALGTGRYEFGLAHISTPVLDVGFGDVVVAGSAIRRR